MSAVVVGILGLVYLVGLSAYLISAVRGAARLLDSLLTPMGLTSEAHMMVGRRYRGMIDGRAVEIVFLPAYGITPALINVTIAADVGARMAFGRERPRLDCTDCARMDASGPGLKDLCIVAEDAHAARRLLADSKANAALRGLLVGQGPGIREIYLQPEAVWLRARPRHPTADSFAHWLNDLRKLAEAGERY
jgi:hypothetical protein